MAKKLMVANWKMNPATLRGAVALARAEDARGAVICPPFEFLNAVGAALKKSSLGAQDVFWKERGAFTGEISPLMLKDAGVKYVIVGHSERRALGETDEMINLKVKASLRAGLKVILCVGEPLAVRKRGLPAAKKFVASQLRKDLRSLQNLKPKTSNLLLAYEPVWAISTSGTGLIDSPEKAGQMARFIKLLLGSKSYVLSPKVLYGGSVTSKNAKYFIEYPGLDGALVGGASLRAAEFRQIIRKAGIASPKSRKERNGGGRASK